uniref:aldolase/citrate lyase family protein n=1 Tax=Yoonia sp. TaxID=2212373 RepID=UPI0035C7DD21
MPDTLDLYMIVCDPQIAGFIATRGVTRLFVDLEYMGKDLRQKGDTWKSKHTLDDVAAVRVAAADAHMMVRVNPLHDGSQAEVDAVLARGADSIMLPMFRSHDDLARFLDIVNGRAEVVPLVETGTALAVIPELLERLSLTRLHIGLNDLHLDMGHSFMFEPIADGTLEIACAALRDADLPFGIGGIARVGEGAITPEHLLGEHVRLGSSAAI